MLSASEISAMIRAKKKKMEEEHSDAVKLSGIPEDATDIDINKLHEPGEMLNENMPMMRRPILFSNSEMISGGKP